LGKKYRSLSSSLCSFLIYPVVWLHTVYVNCATFPPLNRLYRIRFGLRFFCTLKLTKLVDVFWGVFVLLICSHLLITGCKIVQIKTNTFGRSNQNSSIQYIYCHPNLKGSRPVFPNLSDVAVPLTSLFVSHGTPWGKHLFFNLMYFLIISYVRDKVVYCCWVSIYSLINYVILFIYLLFISTSRGTPRKCSRYPRVPRNPGWETLV
jgi:hypothetical protein